MKALEIPTDPLTGISLEALEMALGRLGCAVESNDGGGAGRHDADSWGGINTLRRIKAALAPRGEQDTKERVTVSRQPGNKLFVCVDGHALFEVLSESRIDAEICASGLRAELNVKSGEQDTGGGK